MGYAAGFSAQSLPLLSFPYTVSILGALGICQLSADVLQDVVIGQKGVCDRFEEVMMESLDTLLLREEDLPVMTVLEHQPVHLVGYECDVCEEKHPE